MPANALEEDPPTPARVLQHFLTKLLETEELLQDWHYVTLSTRKDSKQNNFKLNLNKCGQAACRPTSGFQKIKTK